METKYQLAIDALCEKYEIPSIKVIVVEKGELGNSEAWFDTTDGFFIKVADGSSRETLVHEWMHYCFHLINKANDLEESMCDNIFLGVKDDIQSTCPVLFKALEMLPEEDEDEEDESKPEVLTDE